MIDYYPPWNVNTHARRRVYARVAKNSFVKDNLREKADTSMVRGDILDCG